MRRIKQAQLNDELIQTRQQTLAWIDALREDQFLVPLHANLNPPLWELGHIAWFQEYWCTRQRHGFSQSHPYPSHQPNPSLKLDADALYDSAKVAHASRWALPLPTLALTSDYCLQTLTATLNVLAQAPDTDDGLYFFRLALFHEKMHIEALAYSWQSLGYAAGPYPLIAAGLPQTASSQSTDLQIDQAELTMGSAQRDGFVFDNEKWAHSIEQASFKIASHCVSNAQFSEFVACGGYESAQFWDATYFDQLKHEARTMPLYWHLERGESVTRLKARRFDQLLSLSPNDPVTHVTLFEARAYCQWAGRELPSEAQWELATRHPQFNWGAQVCEWTSTVFEPYAGFLADPYREYSEPWFGDHQVIKGTSSVTPLGLANPQFRNFFKPQRNDIFVGFRTCARDV